MTPADLDRRIDRAISNCQDLAMLETVGRQAIEEALGINAWAYLPAVDKLCRRLRELHEKPVFGPPTKESIAEAKANVGQGRVAL